MFEHLDMHMEPLSLLARDLELFVAETARLARQQPCRHANPAAPLSRALSNSAVDRRVLWNQLLELVKDKPSFAVAAGQPLPRAPVPLLRPWLFDHAEQLLGAHANQAGAQSLAAAQVLAAHRRHRARLRPVQLRLRTRITTCVCDPDRGPRFVPGLPHVCFILIELRQALVSYQDHHMCV